MSALSDFATGFVGALNQGYDRRMQQAAEERAFRLKKQIEADIEAKAETASREQLASIFDNELASLGGPAQVDMPEVVTPDMMEQSFAQKHNPLYAEMARAGVSQDDINERMRMDRDVWNDQLDASRARDLLSSLKAGTEGDPVLSAALFAQSGRYDADGMFWRHLPGTTTIEEYDQSTGRLMRTFEHTPELTEWTLQRPTSVVGEERMQAVAANNIRMANRRQALAERKQGIDEQVTQRRALTDRMKSYEGAVKMFQDDLLAANPDAVEPQDLGPDEQNLADLAAESLEAHNLGEPQQVGTIKLLVRDIGAGTPGDLTADPTNVTGVYRVNYRGNWFWANENLVRYLQELMG